MSLSFSTAYRNIQASAALSQQLSAPIMDGCVIMIYAGTTPENADADLGSALLLATYTTNGNGGALYWGGAENGSVSKKPEDIWSATAVNSGAPRFFRYQMPNDDGSFSTDAIRIQGKVGLLSDQDVDLALSSLAIVSGAPLTIDAATATVPAQG